MADVDEARDCKEQTRREVLEAFYTDNSDKRPEQLTNATAKLFQIGSCDDPRHTVWEFMTNHVWRRHYCPLMASAAIYETWQDGEVSTSFLPDLLEVGLEEYEWTRWHVLQDLRDAGPCRILTNRVGDRDFYDGLPDPLMIYRGGAGTSYAFLARGLSWSTSRPIAEWFANCHARLINGGDNEPRLISARIRKLDVLLAFNSECEVVADIRNWRKLRCPRRTARWDPPMWWREPSQPDGT